MPERAKPEQSAKQLLCVVYRVCPVLTNASARPKSTCGISYVKNLWPHLGQTLILLMVTLSDSDPTKLLIEPHLMHSITVRSLGPV